MIGAAFTDEQLLRVIDQIAGGKSLHSIIKANGWCYNTVDTALDARFREKYARAKDTRAHKLAEEILELADQEPERGEDGRLDPTSVNQHRLQVDARKWLASKMLPRVYGDKVHTEHSGQVGWLDLLKAPDAAPKPSEPLPHDTGNG